MKILSSEGSKNSHEVWVDLLSCGGVALNHQVGGPLRFVPLLLMMFAFCIGPPLFFEKCEDFVFLPSFWVSC